MPAAPLRARWFVLLPLLGLVLAGCRLDVVAGVVVAADGTAVLTIETTLDEVLLDELDTLGVDPTIELESAIAATDAWTGERLADDDGGLVLRLTRQVAGPAEIGDVLRGLAEGLGADDPGLVVDVEVELDQDGGTTFGGTAAIRAPATSGAVLDGAPVGPAGTDLEALVAESVTAELRLTLPGEVRAHDADRAEGRTLSWDLTTQPRPVSASAEPAVWWRTLDLPVLLAAAGALVLLAGSVVVVVTRRRR